MGIEARARCITLNTMSKHYVCLSKQEAEAKLESQLFHISHGIQLGG